MKKICLNCKENKSLLEFRKDKNGADKHRTECRSCERKKGRIYDSSDKAIFKRYKYDATRRSRKYEFLLTFEEFSKLINSTCHYCPKDNCRGIDRVDNSLGYTNNNCVPCCGRCNEMKMDKSVEEFYSHIEKIYHKKNQKLSKV